MCRTRSNRFHAVVLVTAMIVAASCEKARPAVSEPPAGTPARETGPRPAIERLRAAVKAGGDLAGVRGAMIELRIQGRSTVDMAIEAIRTDDRRGDFAYSDAAIAKMLDAHLGDFRVPDADVFQKIQRNLAQDETGKLAHKPATDFLAFEVGRSRMLLVRDGNRFAVVFWEDLPALVGDPDSDPTKDLQR